MYISLGLLWLSFKIIYGEITSCPIGGIVGYYYCEELSQVENKKNTCEEFDTPYSEFQSNKPISSAKNEIYHYTIFKKSLILDDTVPIEKLWSEVLETGTDTYRIKFHNKLINRYKKYRKNGSFARIHEKTMGKKKTLSGEFKEYMVLIQSYYAAASTYYFSRNYLFAYEVVTDGLKFFESIEKILYSNNYKTQKKHVDIWNLLLLVLKLDIMTIFIDKNEVIEDSGKIRNAILTKQKKFIDIDYRNPFPSAAVLLYRRYFLDDDNTPEKQKLLNWLDIKELWTNLDDDILYRKHISMYKFLVLFNINSEQKDKLSNILKAIERPVLSIEDRLLNYKATQLALNLIVKPCTDMTDYNKDMCDEFKNYNSNTGIESTTINKLYILYNMNTDLIGKLKTELTTDNHIIDQNILHLIVSGVLDINIKSEVFKYHTLNVKIAIALLNAYTKVHEKKILKEDEQKKFKKKKSNVTAKKMYMNIFKKSDFKEQYYNLFASTKYTTNEIVNNLFIAYKWLMELFAVQSNNSLFYFYTPKFNKAKNNAKRMAYKEKELLGSELLIHDEHFIYLKAKQKSKMLLSSGNWEPSNRPGSWVRDTASKTTLKYFNATKAKENDILEQLIYLKDNSKCPYINRIEIFTIIFRYLWKLEQDYVAMYTNIKSAITEIVVTPEDRFRNLEAHELFTMYLMERNEVAIKLANILDVDQVYNTFLMNPEIRYENNITYKDFWDDENGDNKHEH